MKFTKEKFKTYYINKNKGLVSKEIAENHQCKLEIISATNLFDSSVISKVYDFVMFQRKLQTFSTQYHLPLTSEICFAILPSTGLVSIFYIN